MGNIVDYVRGASASFAQEPLNRVDSLVFSWLAYARIPETLPDACGAEGIRLAQAFAPANRLALVAPLYDVASSEALLAACAASPRFADVVVCRAVDTWSREREVQFSATCFVLPDAGAASAAGAGGAGAADGFTYVAFRGTDDTLVGWKENFNMAFQIVPAQRAACDYLENVAAAVAGPLYVGGHSKGGNLAVFAVNTCAAGVRERVVHCFAHDAPSFTPEVRAAAGWTGTDALVDKTIPEESVVGLLFESSARDVTVIRSTSPGFLQHAPFSWVVEGRDFATARAVSYDSYRANKRLNAWLTTLDEAERERFVEVLYKLANATGEVTMSGLTDSLQNGSLELALQRLDGLPAEDRAFFMRALEDLVATILLGPAPVDAATQTPVERVADAQDKMDDITARFDDRLAKLDKLAGL